MHGGVPIFYSTGNFVTLPRQDRIYARLGYAAELILSRGRVVGFELVPYFIGEGGLHALSGEARQAFLGRLEAVSRPLADPGGILDAWDALIDDIGVAELSARMREVAAAAAGGRRDAQARLRNRLDLPAHRELLVRALSRGVDGRAGKAPRWARELVAEWGRLTVGAGKERFRI